MTEAELRDVLDKLGGWEGFEIAAIRTEPVGEDVFGAPAPRLVLVLQPAPGHPRRCSQCGTPVEKLHDVTVRRVRDLPFGEWDTWLEVPRARLRCPTCGPTVEAVPWLDRYQRMTTRLVEKIARLAQGLPIKQVAAWFGVGWDAVKEIDRRALGARLGAPEDHLDGIRRIAVDEFALHRGHAYATVVLDLERKRVVWIARGRDAGALRGFFTALGPTRCAKLEAAAVDMWQAYGNEIRAQCPQVKLVYDFFHIVAIYGREVVDRVRVDETNRLAKAAGPGPIREARRVIKGARWLLLRNRRSLTTSAERVRLRDLLQANRALYTVYVLKEDLKRLWDDRSPAAALRFWKAWRRRALSSRIAALQKFTALLERHLEGILSHCQYPINSGVLEGCNNKIKVIKRMAYGFRDEAYFFLKIRDAFPGIPG
jgi:transposase